MPQVCAVVSDEIYSEITRQADASRKSKGSITAGLLEYALNEAHREIESTKQEVAYKEKLIEQLEEELGFLRSSYATLQDNIARPLTHLLSKASEKEKSLEV